MSSERGRQADARVQQAIDELQQLIQGRYPAAIFSLYRGEDPEGTYLKATVDVDDTDEVVDLFIDRLIDLQVEERLPIYVVTTRPVERVLEQMRVSKLPRRYRHQNEVVANP